MGKGTGGPFPRTPSQLSTFQVSGFSSSGLAADSPVHFFTILTLEGEEGTEVEWREGREDEGRKLWSPKILKIDPGRQPLTKELRWTVR